MSPRFGLLHEPTSNTLALVNPSESEKEGIPAPDEARATSPLLRPRTLPGTNVPDAEAKAISVTLARASSGDKLLLIGIVAMLLWPWIFLIVVWAWRGIQMNNHVAKGVIDYPQITNFFLTLFGNITSIIVSILFSQATIRFAREWITSNDHITVFDISVISAFTHQNWPWSRKDRKYLLVRNTGRWLPAVSVVGCIVAFALVVPGTTSLIAPVSFHRTVSLTGTELDFSSSAADCLDWFEANQVSNNCVWSTGFRGLNYTSCLEGSQMVDVLESGRSNIRSLLSNNSESLALGELGQNSSLHFLGHMRGVLPTGPNGLHGFDTLQPFPLSDPQTKASILSYNYTLDHQGLGGNITCIYDKSSPIRFSAVPNNTLMVAYNGTCDGLADVITNVVDFVTPNTNNTLTFWACKSGLGLNGEEDLAYYIYLRGRVFYKDTIGNITCTVFPKPAVFPVTYQSNKEIFSSKEPIQTSRNTFSGFIDRAVVALGSIVREGQGLRSNLVAESIFSFGVQSFGLPPYEQNEQYLRLYEAMIQGILVDQVTYTRFMYSTISNPPFSCLRTVNGSLSAEVIGWFAKPVLIIFLMPMTILNLASLIIILITRSRAKGGCHEFDPTDLRPLILAEPSLDEEEPSGWADRVTYRSREFQSFKEKVSE